ncbi:zinc-binding alcohol dehydrogenase family protein [Umezawaea sp. NPDC059074]|uniref:quinone oxidoreductase family protein n=1 Tax=Umezawaea sp. NPDC059074 TaxID=3346716 RepID=UPI0036CE110C
MHVVRVTEFGPADSLEWTEAPDPEPGPGEILVSLTAAAVNRSDLLYRSGQYHSGPPLPAVPGSEGAGTVVALGANAGEFALGDRVVIWGPMGTPGCYAELAAVPVDRALVVPEGVSLVAAAATPIAWLSAWYCLRHLVDVRPGDVVLLNAAASGVGSAAVQIAKDAGATVIAVVGTAEKEQWVRELGADHVVRRDRDDVLATVRHLTEGRGADAALDLVGGDAFATAVRSVGHAGRVAAMANVALDPTTLDTRDFYPKNASIFGFQINDLMRHGWDPRPDLTALLTGIADGRFTVPVDSTFPLAEAAAAHRRLESARTRGKIVLTI